MSVIILSSDDEDECSIIECDGVGNVKELRHEVFLNPDEPDSNESETEILPEYQSSGTVCGKNTQDVKDPFADVDSNFPGEDDGLKISVPMWEDSQLPVTYVVADNQCGDVQIKLLEEPKNIKKCIRLPIIPISGEKNESNLNEKQIEANVTTEKDPKFPILNKQKETFSKSKMQFLAEYLVKALDNSDLPNKSSEEAEEKHIEENSNNIELDPVCDMTQRKPSLCPQSMITKNEIANSRGPPVKNNINRKRTFAKPKICNGLLSSSHELPTCDKVETKSKEIISIKSKNKRGRKVGWRKHKQLVDCNVGEMFASGNLSKISITEESHDQLNLVPDQNGTTTNESYVNLSNSGFKTNEIIPNSLNPAQNYQKKKRKSWKRKFRESEDNITETSSQNISRPPKNKKLIQKNNIKLTSDVSKLENKQVFKSTEELFPDMLTSLTNKTFKNSKSKRNKCINKKYEIANKSDVKINQPSSPQGNNKLKFTIDKCSGAVSVKVVTPTQKSPDDQLLQNICENLSSEIPFKSNTDPQEKREVNTSNGSEIMNTAQENLSNLRLITVKPLKEITEKLLSVPDTPKMLFVESLTNLNSDELLQMKAEFVKLYRSVFDDNLEYICMKLSDLLLLALNEARNCKLRVATANKFTCDQLKHKEIVMAHNTFKKSLQLYKSAFVKSFEDIYKSICNLTVPLEQQRLLIVSWFLKLFLRVTTLSPEFSDSLYEVKTYVVDLLPMETLTNSTAGVLLREEDEFERDCYIVLDFMQECFDANDKPDGPEGGIVDTKTSTKPVVNHNFVESSSGENTSFNKPPNECYSNKEQYLVEKNKEINNDIDQNKTKVTSPVGTYVDEGLATKLLALNQVSVIVKDSSKHGACIDASSDLDKACNKNVKKNTKTQDVMNVVHKSVEKHSSDISVNTQNLSPTMKTVGNAIGKEIIRECSVESKQDIVEVVNNCTSSNSLRNSGNIISENNHYSGNLMSKNQMVKENFSVEQMKETISMNDFQNYYRNNLKKPELMPNKNKYNSQKCQNAGYSNPMLSSNCQYSVPYRHPLPPPYNSSHMKTNVQVMGPRSHTENLQQYKQPQNDASSYYFQTNHGNVCGKNQVGRNKNIEPYINNSQQINPLAYSYPPAYYPRNNAPNDVIKPIHPSYNNTNTYRPTFTNQYPQQQYINLYPNTGKESLINTSNQQKNHYGNVQMNKDSLMKKPNLELNNSLYSMYSAHSTTVNANLVQYPIYNMQQVPTNSLNPESPTKQPHNLQNKDGVTINNFNITTFLPSAMSDHIKTFNSQYDSQYSHNNHSVKTFPEGVVIPEINAKETIHYLPGFQSILAQQTKEP